MTNSAGVRFVVTERERSADTIGAMKAIVIHEDGGPEVLRYEDVPDPEPGGRRGARQDARRRR